MMHRDPLLTFNADRHEYRYGGRVVPSVTQVLDVVGRFKYWDSIEMQEARERGTAVHLITHLYDMDELDPDSVDEIYQPYLDAYVKFRRESGIVILESEQQVWHGKYEFAGTLDRVGELRKKIGIYDLKTGLDYPTFGPQTAAYKNAWEHQHGRKAHERYIVKLMPNGNYRLTEMKNPQDWGVFLSALNIHKFFHQKG